MLTFIFIYAFVMVQIILGAGVHAADIAKWKVETGERYGNKVYLTQYAKAAITWPWFDINKIREIYP